MDKNFRNLPTEIGCKVAISEWILKGIEKKHFIWGPFFKDKHPNFVANLHISPLGCVPKPNDGHRPIHHLSAPRNGNSVNSFIDQEFKEVTYVKFKEVVALVHNLGKNAKIWTVDAKDAYLRVPIKDKNKRMMGFKWYNMYFCFSTLSFGLASACQIYTLFADAIEWISIASDPKTFSENNSKEYVYRLTF